jgi:hypothetical protein
VGSARCMEAAYAALIAQPARFFENSGRALLPEGIVDLSSTDRAISLRAAIAAG